MIFIGDKIVTHTVKIPEDYDPHKQGCPKCGKQGPVVFREAGSGKLLWCLCISCGKVEPERRAADET